VAIVLAMLEPPPGRLGVTHWSPRLLAAWLGISNVKVADVWRKYGLQRGGGQRGAGCGGLRARIHIFFDCMFCA
jgi:hypothetical protein